MRSSERLESALRVRTLERRDQRHDHDHAEPREQDVRVRVDADDDEESRPAADELADEVELLSGDGLDLVDLLREERRQLRRPAITRTAQTAQSTRKTRRSLSEAKSTAARMERVGASSRDGVKRGGVNRNS